MKVSDIFTLGGGGCGGGYGGGHDGDHDHYSYSSYGDYNNRHYSYSRSSYDGRGGGYGRRRDRDHLISVRVDRLLRLNVL
ncbi:MAG: hypothetical protein JO287_09730 [Pseudonocardiales bacterium]|nr:hypothetical protein [Pseudonocardiales bacterium]